MKNNFYIKHVISQLENLLALGEQVENAEFTQGVLYNALTRLKERDAETSRDGSVDPWMSADVNLDVATPDSNEMGDIQNEGEGVDFVQEVIESLGVDSVVSYDEALNADGIPVVRNDEVVALTAIDESTGEQVNVAIVGGYGVSAETGDLVELPGTDESIRETNRLLEESGLEINTDGLLRIVYVREDGEELTNADVTTIINAPISAGLRKFSENLQVLDIVDGESANIKIAVFVPLDRDDNNLDITAIALGMVNYGGSVAFPNLGLITARAEVNAEWNND